MMREEEKERREEAREEAMRANKLMTEQSGMTASPHSHHSAADPQLSFIASLLHSIAAALPSASIVTPGHTSSD